MIHFGKFCKTIKDISKIDEKKLKKLRDDAKETFDRIYNINLSRMTLQHILKTNHCRNFKVEVVTNNTLGTIIIDTGSKIRICSLQQVKKWKSFDKMFPLNTKLKPLNSDPIKVEGQTICAVTFGSSSVPVKWHVISAECEPILAGSSTISLGIIKFNHKQGILAPIKMI